MGSSPAFQMYTGEWLKTAALSKCEPATRGIWIDLCCAIWDADDEGRITGTVSQLARVARCSPDQMEEALAEFDENGVAGLESDGDFWIITSRRMEKQLAEMHGNRDRAKKYRQKKKAEKTSRESNGKVTDKITPPSRTNAEEGRRKTEDCLRGESAERGDALSVFVSVTGYDPPVYYRDKIQQTVKSLDRWEAVCQRWVDSEYRPQNVDGLLELYRKTGETNGKDQRPLTARQLGALSIPERLERGGYRPEDFLATRTTSDASGSGEGGRTLGPASQRTNGPGA